jgi:alkylation response protein AidB-like acyl-CoA dehydrogenase
MIQNKNRSEAENASIEVAEDAREIEWKSKSFMAALYMGDLDISLAAPFPFQGDEDAAIGDEICARVEAWCLTDVDGDAIDKNEEIPAHVFKGMQDLGLFAIKIPKKYGGLGLSQANYLRILQTVSEHCASSASTLSAHQSIGVPQPLKLFGSEAQKAKYLPMIAQGAITAFALTESSVGSDPANMNTSAVLSEDGKHWILNGEKLWCTNGAVADLLVVMCSTPPAMKKGREISQISAFVVETQWEGVEVVHRCHFMGIRAIENALIRFTDVKIPVENLIWETGRGLRLALATLNDGRLGIPAIAAGGLNTISGFSASWAKSRFQWGKFIGEHEAGSDKLARITAGAYAMDTLSKYATALADKGDVDIRVEAASAKLFNSELGWDLIDTAMQLRGGRGFETSASLAARGEVAFPIERAMRDARINRIVEGTTDVMHLFLAREALDGHLQRTGTLFKKASVGEKLMTVVKAAGFYPFWYAKLWVGGLFKSFPDFDDNLARHLHWVDARTRKLARVLFHNMVLLGPKLEMRQLTLGRVVDLGVELAVMALVAARAQSEARAGDDSQMNTALYWLESSRIRVDDLFREINSNTDASARALAKELMDRAETLPEVKAVDFPPRAQEKGSDLTSGRQDKRLSQGGVVGNASAKASK